MKETMKDTDEWVKIFAREMRAVLLRTGLAPGMLTEIRMRIGQPLILLYENEEWMVNGSGELIKDKNQAFRVTQTHMGESLSYICNYSLYAYEEEVRQGFITIQGGHRIGLAGRVVSENGKIRTIKPITCMNIRFAHEIKGCSRKILPCLYEDREALSTLIISPPGCGKTTLLRDLIMQISNGSSLGPGVCVGVVDERSELGASYMGIPQNDLGIRTDVLDACPKAEGMMLLIRTMTPRVLAVDEIGGPDDFDALKAASSCGCRILATVHGDSLADIRAKPELGGILSQGYFKRYVVLSRDKRPGTVRGVYGRGMEKEPIWES